MMTLRRKLVYQIATLIASLLLAGISAIWQINAMQSDFGVALADYERLERLYEVGTHVSAARLYLGIHADRSNAQAELQSALDAFNKYFPPGSESLDADEQKVRAALTQLAGADLDAMNASPATLDSVLTPMIRTPLASNWGIRSRNFWDSRVHPGVSASG